MELIPEEFSLEKVSTLDDKAMFQMILDRVEHLMEHDIDLLMSYLYRLDVEEKDILIAMNPGNPVAPTHALARLILDRQIKRLKTKRKYKQDPIEGWEF